MAKKTVFISRKKYPQLMYELLNEKFELICWDEAEPLTKSELIKNIKGKYGIICAPDVEIDKEVIQAAGNDLKVVSTYSVGYDHLDIKELKFRGIRIGFTPDISIEAVAEHAIGILLATGRRIVEAHNCVLKGNWGTKDWSPIHVCGHGLNKSTVGIAGCGQIGISILKKIKMFKPHRMFYYSRSEKLEAKNLGAELKPLDYLIKESDFIIVVLSLNEETNKIINRKRINSMKSNAIFVNVGRGGLVDEEALIEALQNNKIGGAGLDVFTKEPLPLDSPLLKLDNVVITPHAAAYSYECANTMAEISAKNILAVLNNEEMPGEL